jgi:hypothetical protein
MATMQIKIDTNRVAMFARNLTSNITGQVLETVAARTDQALQVKAAGLATAGDKFVQCAELDKVLLPTFTFIPEEHQAIAFLRQVLEPEVVNAERPQPKISAGLVIRDPVTPTNAFMKRIAETMPGTADGSKREVYRAQLIALVKAAQEIEALGRNPAPAQLQAIVDRHGIGFLSEAEIRGAKQALETSYVLSAKLLEQPRPVTQSIYGAGGVVVSAVYDQSSSTARVESGWDVMQPSDNLFAGCRVDARLALQRLDVTCPTGCNLQLAAVDKNGTVIGQLASASGPAEFGASAQWTGSTFSVAFYDRASGNRVTMDPSHDLLVVISKDVDGNAPAQGLEVVKSLLIKGFALSNVSDGVITHPKAEVIDGR